MADGVLQIFDADSGGAGGVHCYGSVYYYDEPMAAVDHGGGNDVFGVRLVRVWVLETGQVRLVNDAGGFGEGVVETSWPKTDQGLGLFGHEIEKG